MYNKELIRELIKTQICGFEIEISVATYQDKNRVLRHFNSCCKAVASDKNGVKTEGKEAVKTAVEMYGNSFDSFYMSNLDMWLFYPSCKETRENFTFKQK